MNLRLIANSFQIPMPHDIITAIGYYLERT